jgi:G patch domain-containing protein 1
MSFVKLGTKKEDQKDNKRQKLHGAFQGGFSAGYYNTVGSKEGWKPKQFTSSKSSNFTQTKTDFMDEEDYKEFGHVLINEEYAELGSTERELNRQKLKGIEIEEDFIVKNDEFGKNLLKLMIGSLKKEYNTVSVDFNDLGSSVHGRGFDPLKDAPEFKKKKQEVAPVKEKNKGGFGTGIFEYEDEYGDLDDYDIPSTQYDTVIFDEDDPLPTFSKKSSEKPVKLKGLLPGFKPAHEMKKCAPKMYAGF